VAYVFDDGLSFEWTDNTFSASAGDFREENIVFAGERSIFSNFQPSTSNRISLQLEDINSPMDISQYDFFTFAAYGTADNIPVTIFLTTIGNVNTTQVRARDYGGAIPNGSWQVYRIPLADLDVGGQTPTEVTRVWLRSFFDQAPVYFDNVGFEAAPNNAPTVVAEIPTQFTRLNSDPVVLNLVSGSSGFPTLRVPVFDDIEDAPADLVYTVEGNTNSALVTATLDNNTDQLTLTLVPALFGEADITVRATDSRGNSVDTTFTLVVDPPYTDVNFSGNVTPADAVFIINRLGLTPINGDQFADVDNDGDIDTDDLNLVMALLGTSPTPTPER
jgi:hypothetical protein